MPFPFSSSARRRAATLLAALSIPALGSGARAQPQERAAAPAAAAAGVDPDHVLAGINDLGLLKALLPLRLTDEQRTRLLATLRQVAEEGKTAMKQDAEALRALAAEIEQARAGALAGTPISSELEARVAAAGKAAEARHKRARTAALGRILVVAKEVLTPEQREEIEAQSERANGGRLVPRQYQSDPSKAPREAILDLASASFIERVLLNGRAIEVLSQMKTPSVGTPSVETPGADTPPAPPSVAP